MTENNIDELINDVKNKFTRTQDTLFIPYIKQIRFPKYKGLIPDSLINFNYPLTILVGVNGTNKTSVLQALYGTIKGQSVGKYWFSSEVDKISSKEEEKHRMIYKYFHKGANKDVEVIKSRVSRKNNPDYWESSRPLIKDKMKMPSINELRNAKNESDTRWDLIDKNIVYCDFKEYVSAFDMFFYHYEFKGMQKNKTKQDFIRSRSIHLAKVFSKGYETYLFHKLERVESCRFLDEIACKTISEIMDQEYTEIKIVTHKFYAKQNNVKALKTILMRKKELDHTEAFAGSGESRLIMLIDDILNAVPKSLILIDEPEINLHPRALVRFQKFLLKQILEKSHQIVLTTHSHFLIDRLPVEAIKLFQKTENGVSIVENIHYTDAFLELGEELDKEVRIFVEDRLVKEIIDTRIKKRKIASLSDIVQVIPLPGGAKSIIKDHIHSSSVRKDRDVYYVLDGDQNMLEEKGKFDDAWIVDNKLDQQQIPTSENKNLGKIIKKLTGVEVKFSPSGGENKESEIYDMQRSFLDFWKGKVWFLNSTTPECAILESLNDGKRYHNEDVKKLYEHKAKQFLYSEEVNAEEIFIVQKRDINQLSDDCELNNRVDEILDCIIENLKEK